MAGVDFPMRAIRQQISRALDLVVQIERFSDGSRKVTSITEVQRMEGETVTLQEIFEYKIDKAASRGSAARSSTQGCARSRQVRAQRRAAAALDG
jgi:pilus assembly protein CpaF